jgi:predicted alpha/beta-fold hydrolase
MGEQSFPMRPERLVRLSPPIELVSAGSKPTPAMTTREWAEAAHAAASIRLPREEAVALTTDQLAENAHVIDVWTHFGIRPDETDDLFHNWKGIEQTAEVCSPAPEIEGGHIQRGPWRDFKDIEVPMEDGARLFGRIGVPSEANAISGSFVILTHGLFGTLDGLDMENQAQALRRAGHHVLALEMRGHGETNCRHPEYAMTFGLLETGDLVSAARWLKTTQGATRVGLVSFSITGYETLLMAWVDGYKPVTEFAGNPSFRGLPRRENEPAFNGGLFVVSVPIGILDLADRFEERVMTIEAPAKSTFQDHVRARLEAYNEPPAHGMWDLARSEFRRAGFLQSEEQEAQLRVDFTRFLDFSRDNWQVGVRRMENIRVPVLVLSSANDPLGTAQGVADLFGRVRNPNIGVVMLKGGGHMGFSALSADYYYSLMINFFDRTTSPRAVAQVGERAQK